MMHTLLLALGGAAAGSGLIQTVKRREWWTAGCVFVAGAATLAAFAFPA